MPNNEDQIKQTHGAGDQTGSSTPPNVTSEADYQLSVTPKEVEASSTHSAEDVPAVTATTNTSDFDFEKFFITAEEFLSTKPISVAQDDKTPAPKPIVKKNSDNTGTITHDKYKITLGKDAKDNATISVESPKDSLNELLLLFKKMAQERNEADGKIIFEITDPKHLTQEKLDSLLEKIDYGDLKDRIEIRLPNTLQSTHEVKQEEHNKPKPVNSSPGSTDADSPDAVTANEELTTPKHKPSAESSQRLSETDSDSALGDNDELGRVVSSTSNQDATDPKVTGVALTETSPNKSPTWSRRSHVTPEVTDTSGNPPTAINRDAADAKVTDQQTNNPPSVTVTLR